MPPAGPAGAAEPTRPAPRPPVLVHQDDVDGVPVLWTPSRGGELTARLRFRLGTVDENPHSRGLVHLLTHCLLATVEHAARRDPAGRARAARLDAEVTPLFTEVTVAGGPADVAAALRLVARAVAVTPEAGLLARECELIATEGAHGWVPDPIAAVLGVTRFGFGPFGMEAMREVGLWGLRPDDLTAVAQRHLTRGNAVLELDGDLPAGLRLPLPDGPPAPVPAVPAPRLARTWTSREIEQVAWTTVMPDLPAFTALASVVRDELVRRLPGRDPRATPTATLDRLAPGHLRLLVRAPVTVETGEVVRDTLLDALPALATRGGEAELARLADRCREVLGSAVDPLAQIPQAATSMLLGTPPRGARARLHDLVTVTPAQLREAAAFAWEDLTVLVPRTLPLRRADVVEHDLGTSAPLPGPQWRMVPAVPDVHGSRLVISDDAVQLRGPLRARQRCWTVPLDRCAGVLAWPDGRRDVLGTDGTTISVEPAHWSGGHAAVARLDALVPLDRVAWQPPRPAGAGEPVTVGEPAGSWALLALTALAWVSGLVYAAYWTRQGAWAVIEHLPAELLVIGGAAVLGTLFQVQLLWRERRRRRLPPWRLRDPEV